MLWPSNLSSGGLRRRGAYLADRLRPSSADVADKDEGGHAGGGGEQGSEERDGKKGGNSGAVVGDSGTIQARACWRMLSGVLAGNTVSMCALRETERLAAAGMDAEDIADFVDEDVFESEFGKALPQPLSAGGLAEGRSGNARHLQLPAGKLRLVSAQPAKSRPALRAATRDTRDLLLQTGKHFRSFDLGGGRHGPQRHLITTDLQLIATAAP